MKNGENSIKQTLDSIVAQDYPHEELELVFVDDGSEDNTLSIIKEFVATHDISSKVFHTSWKGLGHARNMIAANASGDYILWVDGDMILERGYVQKQVDFLKDHPGIGVAKGVQALEPAANLLATLEMYSRAVGKMIDFTNAKTRPMALGTGGAIYRIGALKEAGGFDENLRGYGEDLDIELRLRSLNYLLSTNEAKYFDYERLGLTWHSLWRRYWRRGYCSHYFYHKHRGLFKSYKNSVFASFLLGLFHARKLFKLTGKKAFFFLPFVYGFRSVAWNGGFIESHLKSYEPN